MRSGALIESWFDMLTDEQRPIARALHAAVTAAAPSLHATVRWGNIVYQHEGTNALAIVPHKSHVNLQLFRGAAVAPMYPQLEGSGKGVRHLKLRAPEAVNADFIARLTAAAIDALDVPEPH
ncbi:DUF1801 domain-containing protein [Ideonella sp. BN130291]|uniref:DUF1801 domain-containing protein n=1 Tax=Ideonella sp. BN130291 TaxID=3112940 RepID=UPI002E26AF8B